MNNCNQNILGSIPQIQYREYNYIKEKMNEGERNAVEIYLRIKGPMNRMIQPEFKLSGNDTKIRFKSGQSSEEQDIMNEFAGVGVYKFQKIFREDSKQEDVYLRVAQDLVQSAIEGYNGTIFAYGQTGSGKTFTMTGGDDDPTQMGIIPRVIDQLYREAEQRDEEITIKLKYMQIYKQNGYDLLNPANKSKKLQQLVQVKPFSKADNFEFEGLSEHEAPTFQQAMKIYELGDTNRIVCKTPSNDQSSRSHCIFMIGVKTKNRDTGLQQKATINLVDLAGSQRIHNSGMEETQAKQGISINLGLYYLSRVVLALGQQSKTLQKVHVPYRDSLLTMALKSSMGGNCKTRMIATINPNPIYNPQNIATCKFSQNLLCMENKLKKNQFINPWDIIKGLKNQIQQLKGEISRLKGEDVKQILERKDYIKIHKLVDDFIASQNSVQTLPINDRLYIRQYLNYMRTIIKQRKKVKKDNFVVDNQSQVREVSEYYVFEVKNLKQQIQQKQNQIQLLLSLINHKKSQSPQDLEDNMLYIENNNQQKIAQTVLNQLNRGKGRKPINITIQQVQKNLLKPIQLKKDESVEQSFKKFKDAHIKTQDITEKDHEIKLREMKKDVIMKKIKNLKYQRAKLNENVQQKIKNKPKQNKLPNLLNLADVQDQQQIQKMKQQVSQIDDKLKKKYQQLKSIQLEISRLGLCKNKNNQKLQTQFNQYMVAQSRKNSQLDDQNQVVNPQKTIQTFSDAKIRKTQEKRIKCQSTQSSFYGNKKENEIIQIDNQEVNKHMQQFFLARQKLKQKIKEQGIK